MSSQKDGVLQQNLYARFFFSFDGGLTRIMRAIWEFSVALPQKGTSYHYHLAFPQASIFPGSGGGIDEAPDII